MSQYVYVVQSRMDENEQFEFGSAWATRESALAALREYAEVLNTEDPEAKAWVEVADDASGDRVVVARTHEYGFCDSYLVQVLLQGVAK